MHAHTTDHLSIVEFREKYVQMPNGYKEDEMYKNSLKNLHI
jgi:hypothetical protein